MNLANETDESLSVVIVMAVLNELYVLNRCLGLKTETVYQYFLS